MRPSLAQNECFVTADLCYAHPWLCTRLRVPRSRGVVCHRGASVCLPAS